MKKLSLLAVLAIFCFVPSAVAFDGGPSMPYCDVGDDCSGGGGGTPTGDPTIDQQVMYSDEGEDWGWSWESEPGTMAMRPCKWSGASVYTTDPTRTITGTRSKLAWHWCWNGGQVTQVDTVYAWSSWSIYPWEYKGLDEGPKYDPHPGFWEARIHAQYEYQACPVFGWNVVCFKSVHPWLTVHLYGNGQYYTEAGGWLLDS